MAVGKSSSVDDRRFSIPMSPFFSEARKKGVSLPCAVIVDGMARKVWKKRLNFREFFSVLKNSSMVLWSPDQGLKYPFPAVFWPWFGSVGFIFDLPTGQIATFSTGCLLLGTWVNKGK